MDNTTVGLQMNMRQLLNVLSSSLYKGDILSVATRELLQNSFDAVKKVSDPQIQVNFDSYKRTLEFKDNGIGMSPDTVKDVFLTIGGTAKEGLDETERSGGFGIAKVQFFTAAEHIRVESVRDGVKTIIDTTREDLIDQRAKCFVERVQEESGTRVVLKFPRTYEDATGKINNIYLYESSVTNPLKKPLVGYNIPILFNGSTVNNALSYKHCIKEEYDWGIVYMYYSPKLKDSSDYCNASVHCAGLYQFLHQKYMGDGRGCDLIFNILPKYAAGQREYPFANSRDDFSGYVKPDIEKLMKAVEKLMSFLHQEKIRKEYSSFGKLEYLEVDGKMHQREIMGESDDDFDIDGFLDGIGDLGALMEAIAKMLEMQAERAKKMAQEKEDGKDSCIKFINKTNRTFTHKDHEKFSKIASIVYDAIYEPNIRDTFSRTVSTAGVIIDDNLGGVCLTLGGVTGIYLNPVSIHQNANHFANRMMETLIHELAHGKYSGHHEDFFNQMALIRNIMWKYNLYERWHGKFMEIYLQYNGNKEEVVEPTSTKEEDEIPF